MITFAALFRRLLGNESATTKIVRKQTRIDTVVSRESAAISAAVQGEIAAIVSYAQSGLRRIDALVNTGVIDTATINDLAKVRKSFAAI